MSVTRPSPRIRRLVVPLLCRPQSEGSVTLWGSLHLPASVPPQPSALHRATGQRPHQWPWEGGEGAGRSRLRRWRQRGGGAEEQLHLLYLPIALQAVPPEFAFARTSVVPTLWTEAAHHSTRAARVQRDRGLGSLHLGARGFRPGPAFPAQAPQLTARPACGMRAARRPRAAPGSLGICARRPSLPPEVGLAEPQLLPGDRGAENCARCPPLPPRRCHRWEQRRQSRVGRPGLRSFHPPSRRAALPPRAARVRPEAARRAGCAVPAPRDPSFRSRGIGVCEGPGWGGDQPLSLSGGCCNPAVAMATRT